MAAPFVILDDARRGRIARFSGLCGTITASEPEAVPQALAEIDLARASGRHVAGYFSYELGYLLEPRLAPLLPPGRTVPLLWFGIFDRLEEGPAELVSAGRAYAGPLRLEWDELAYVERFRQVQSFVAAGDIYQANLSFRARFAFAGDPLALYLNLRAQSAAAYGAYVDDGTRQILSLSPELFFDLAAGGVIKARPMKGTAARGDDPLSDARARTALAASIKDRAENLMIVDLLRNDLGRIAELGSVGVEDLFAIETYPTLHTMVSTVTARLKGGMDVAAIVRALYPCGSITGAPKIRAMEIIHALERSPRGIYAGAIGHFSPDGSARFNVAIRTLTITGGTGELGIGGAVVQDSRSASEYAECLLKARYFESARRPLCLIETMRWVPGTGILRRDLHLARLARSAATFGIAFDRARATACLDASVGGDSDLRVRLTLDEQGEFATSTAPISDSADAVWRHAISPIRLSSGDALAQHKIDWRETYDGEFARLRADTGCDEVIFLNERGEVAEGSRTNVFVRRDRILMTPPLSGILDGCLRRDLLDRGECCEAVLTLDDLAKGDVYLGNSLRGLIRTEPVATPV